MMSHNYCNMSHKNVAQKLLLSFIYYNFAPEIKTKIGKWLLENHYQQKQTQKAIHK